MELGLNMASLYAENDQLQVTSALIAKSGHGMAAETCLVNETILATNFLLIHVSLYTRVTMVDTLLSYLPKWKLHV